MTPPTFYDSIELTPEEEKEAIREAKRKKYFDELHREYWEELERQKPNNKERKTGLKA